MPAHDNEIKMTTELTGPVVVGAPDTKHAGSTMELNRSNNQTTYTAISWSSAAALHAGGVFFIRSRSATIGTFEETLDGDQLGEMEYFGVGANNALSQIAAACRVFQDGPAGPARVPTRWEWGTGTAYEDVRVRFSIDSKGQCWCG